MDTMMWVQNIVAIIAVILIPVTGLTIILTTRLAFRPLVETLARVLKDSGLVSPPELLSQINQLSEQVDSLKEHVQRLEEAQDFDRKLLEAPTDEVGMLR